MGVMFFFQLNLKDYEAKCDEEILSPADYSIIVGNIPKQCNLYRADKIKEFFEEEAKKISPGWDKYVNKVNLIFDT